jgi:hypothetical protein
MTKLYVRGDRERDGGSSRPEPLYGARDRGQSAGQDRLASLRAADFLPEIWLPDADTARLRRLVTRRNQVV